jgi:hypothetical protein
LRDDLDGDTSERGRGSGIQVDQVSSVPQAQAQRRGRPRIVGSYAVKVFDGARE